MKPNNYKNMTEIHERREGEAVAAQVVGAPSQSQTMEQRAAAEMLANRATCEAFCMNNDITPEEMRSACECVLSEWALTRPYHTNEADARRHLLSTIRVRIAEKRKEALRRGGLDARIEQERRAAQLYAEQLQRTLAESRDRDAEPLF